MRFHEILEPAKVKVIRSAEDQKNDSERRRKLQVEIDKARSRTAKAAQVYSDRREADDDAEREAKRTLVGG